MLEAVPDAGGWASPTRPAGLGANAAARVTGAHFPGQTAAVPGDAHPGLAGTSSVSGARYPGGRAVELRLHGDVTRWSRFATHCISLEGSPWRVPTGADRPPARHRREPAPLWAGHLRRARRRQRLAARAGGSSPGSASRPPPRTPPGHRPSRRRQRGRTRAGDASRRLRPHVSASFAGLWYATATTRARPAGQRRSPHTRADGVARYGLWLGLLASASRSGLAADQSAAVAHDGGRGVATFSRLWKTSRRVALVCAGGRRRCRALRVGGEPPERGSERTIDPRPITCCGRYDYLAASAASRSRAPPSTRW